MNKLHAHIYSTEINKRIAGTLKLLTYDVDKSAAVDILSEDKKVDAYLKVVAACTRLLPAPHIYDEFYLGKDGRTLYLKNGVHVTHLKYRTLKSHWRCRLHSNSLGSWLQGRSTRRFTTTPAEKITS